MTRTIVITGGSSGVGAAAARALRQGGAHVVLTGRSPATAEVARAVGADHFLVDYASLGQVREFATALLDRYPRIDALVNNVGGVFAERRVTEDGHEMTLQVNHLAGFLLTALLRERLEQSQAVVVNTSSVAHLLGRLDFADLQSTRSYRPFRAYGTAKLMNILHAQEVARRFAGVAAASFHPGAVASGFAREGGFGLRLVYQTPLRQLFLISPERGADTLQWLLGSRPGQDWAPGGYFAWRRPGRVSGQVTPGNAERLWQASEQLLS